MATLRNRHLKQVFKHGSTEPRPIGTLPFLHKNPHPQPASVPLSALQPPPRRTRISLPKALESQLTLPNMKIQIWKVSSIRRQIRHATPPPNPPSNPKPLNPIKPLSP